jgi:hypothetical protein
VLEQFVNNGWCEIVGSCTDKRFRHVVASKKLTSAFEAYEQIFIVSFAKLVIQRASDIQSSNDDAFDEAQLAASSDEHQSDEQMR